MENSTFKPTRRQVRRVRAAADECEFYLREAARVRGDLPGEPMLVSEQALLLHAANASARAFRIARQVGAGQ